MDVERRPQTGQRGQRAGVGDRRLGLVDCRLGLDGLLQGEEKVGGPRKSRPDAFDVRLRVGLQRPQPAIGLLTAAEPGLRVGQVEPGIETAARGDRGGGQPFGQREIQHLDGRPGRRGQQVRVGVKVGVEHEHGPAQGVLGAPGSGRGDRPGDSAAQPPGPQQPERGPPDLAIQWMREPCLQPPPVRGELDQPARLRLLDLRRAGQLGEQARA